MIELVLTAPGSAVEPLSDRLLDELGALSVTVEDADAKTPAEHALFGEPGLPAPAQAWQRSTLTALFETAAAAGAAAAALRAAAPAGALQLLPPRPLQEQDWVRLTQSQFAPVEITPALWVVPSWHAAPAGARQVIALDPGLAFGTGTHPTTRLCLRWLAADEAALAGKRVLDYGCGSGILAIGAALLGAADVLAVDVDAVALQAARDNVARNRASVACAAPDAVHGRFDVVVANILAAPLKLLAPLLAAHVAPGGRLLLAGILERQADELTAAYAPWLALQVADRDDGWVLMTAVAVPAAGDATEAG